MTPTNTAIIISIIGLIIVGVYLTIREYQQYKKVKVNV